MAQGRRAFLGWAATSLLAGVMPSMSQADAVGRPRFKAIAFDAFPIFDPRPIAALAESLLPGKGQALMTAWRVRQFEYQWLRSMGGQYVDFLQATEDSLVFACRQLDLELTPAAREALTGAWSNLQVWPDARDAIDSLHQAGVRLAFLSNMTSGMLTDGLKRAGLDDTFEAVLSTDRVRAFKPDPRAYQMGVDLFGLRKEEVLFVAFAAWDVAGAKWFGYPTFWLNRMNAPHEELGAAADAVGSDLAALQRFVLGAP